MTYLTPSRRPRRSCGSISALQTTALFIISAFMVTLVVLGHPLVLVATIALAVLALVLGRPVPTPTWLRAFRAGATGGQA